MLNKSPHLRRSPWASEEFLNRNILYQVGISMTQIAVWSLYPRWDINFYWRTNLPKGGVQIRLCSVVLIFSVNHVRVNYWVLSLFLDHSSMFIGSILCHIINLFWRWCSFNMGLRQRLYRSKFMYKSQCSRIFCD